jgi:curved DNA-binding protein CbpA
MRPEKQATVDQIFDRLEHLFKSWSAPDADTGSRRGPSSSGDADLDAAMSELDDYLDKDREAAEARTKERERLERERRAREEAARSAARNAAGRAARPAPSSPSGPPAVVMEAYKTLGLAYGAPPATVKAAYKKLLLRYHPDRNSGSAEAQKRATDISARINEAYRVIETWTSTGAVSA